MKKKLQMFLTLALLVGGVTTAWADDYDGTSPVYSPTTATNYSSLKDAVTAFGSSSATTFEIDLYGDVTIDARIEVASAKTLNIVPKANVKLTRKDLNRTTIWFLTKTNSSATINIGSADYKLTIAGAGHADNQRIFKTIFCREQGNITVTNVLVQNVKFDTEGSNYGYLYSDKNATGVFTMTDVTVKNCVTTEEAFIKSIRNSNDAIVLNNTIDFEDCTGVTFDVIRRIKVGKTAGVDKFTTNTAPLTIKWEGTGDYAKKIGQAIVVNSVASQAKLFDVTDGDWGLVHSGNDLKLTQAYTLAVSDAAAATLVLPFEATIPAAATCYTLNYTAGDDKVTATEVETTLAANTPVLVNAAEGNHKFVSTATSGDAATGSGTHTEGALTGVYAETVVPTSSYILTNGGTGVGFRKADGTTNKVAANRAYLTADGAAHELFIDYGGTAGITTIAKSQEPIANGQYYDLSGRHVAQPTKGLYIVNGRKVIVK